MRPRSGRPRKFSQEAVTVLERVWAISGGSCGKYLAVAMPALLEALENHGELVSGQRRYCPEVRSELLGMSAATIDRYLAKAKARGALHGMSTTKPGTLLRTSITIRKAGDEVEADPGFFEADTVAHCGPTLKGEFARTVNLTDMITVGSVRVFEKVLDSGAQRVTPNLSGRLGARAPVVETTR